MTNLGERGTAMLALAAPVIFLLFWASGFAVGKIGLEHAQPLTFLALRFAALTLLFLPAYAVLRPKAPPRRRDWLHLAAVGLLIQAGYFGFAYLGMSLGVSAGAAAVIASLQPLIVAGAAPFVSGERIGRLQWLGFLLGAAGAVLVVTAEPNFDAALDAGLLFCLASAFGMAGATLYQKRFPVAVHPVTVNLVHAAVGLVAIAPLALVLEDRTVDWSVPLVASLGWLILANSILAISLLLFMIGRNEASRVSALFFLIPPVAALQGWALIGETLAPAAWAGMAVALAGIWLVARIAPR